MVFSISTDTQSRVSALSYQLEDQISPCLAKDVTSTVTPSKLSIMSVNSESLKRKNVKARGLDSTMFLTVHAVEATQVSRNTVIRACTETEVTMAYMEDVADDEAGPSLVPRPCPFGK